MSRKVSIKILLMSLLYLHHLVLRSPVASFATMPKPSAAIIEDQCRGLAVAEGTRTHRNFRDQETRHSFSFWWILSFTTPPAYAISLLHSCFSCWFLANHLCQAGSFTVRSLEVFLYGADIPPACFICVDREFVLVSKHWDAFLWLVQQAVFTPERLLPTEPLKRHIGAFLY